VIRRRASDRSSERAVLCRNGRRTRLAIAAWVLVALSCSCHRRGAPSPETPRLRLGKLEISVIEGGDGKLPPLDANTLAGHLRTQIEKSGLVATSPLDAGPPLPTLRVLGRVATDVVESDHKGLCRAGVNLAISTRPSDAPGAINDEISATGEERFEVVPGVDVGGIAARLADRTASDLLAAFVRRTRLRGASAVEIHDALTGDGGAALHEEAIRVVGERRLAGEAPTLLDLLDDNDEPTRDAALGALIALRDPRAVTKLTRDRSLGDRREMLKTLEAISLIGGAEAAQYLSFVADSHDDPEIRQAAREARDRMNRRAVDAAAAGR